jgi:hypothetical protein
MLTMKLDIHVINRKREGTEGLNEEITEGDATYTFWDEHIPAESKKIETFDEEFEDIMNAAYPHGLYPKLSDFITREQYEKENATNLVTPAATIILPPASDNSTPTRMLNLLTLRPNSIQDASAQITTDINTEALHHGDAMMDAVQIILTPRPTNLWKPANVDKEKGSEDTNEPISIFTTNAEVAHPDDRNKNSSKNGREAETNGEGRLSLSTVHSSTKFEEELLGTTCKPSIDGIRIFDESESNRGKNRIAKDVDLTALLHGGSVDESEGDKGGEETGSTPMTVAANQHGTHYQPTVFQKQLLLKTYFYLSFHQLLLPPGEAFPQFHHSFWSQCTAFLDTWDNATDEQVVLNFPDIFKGCGNFSLDKKGILHPPKERLLWRMDQLAEFILSKANVETEAAIARAGILKKVSNMSNLAMKKVSEFHDVSLRKRLHLQAYTMDVTFDCQCSEASVNWLLHNISDKDVDIAYDIRFQGYFSICESTRMPLLDLDKALPIADQAAVQQTEREHVPRMSKANQHLGIVRSMANDATKWLNQLHDQHILKVHLLNAYGTPVIDGKGWGIRSYKDDVASVFSKTFSTNMMKVLPNGMFQTTTQGLISVADAIDSELREAVERADKLEAHTQLVHRIKHKAVVDIHLTQIFCNQDEFKELREMYKEFWLKGNKYLDANGGPTHAELTYICVCNLVLFMMENMDLTKDDIIADPGCRYGTMSAMLGYLLGLQTLGYECCHERVMNSMQSYIEALSKITYKEQKIQLALFQLNIWQLQDFNHATILVLNDEAFPAILTKFICDLIRKSTTL